MASTSTTAIVGGGPAGALAAAQLARAGHPVTLFDEKLAWEKPCGGGLTHKAIQAWPFLAECRVERNWARQCELISPAGRRVSFHLDRPVAIFSRHVLNGLLLEESRKASARVIESRVLGIDGNAGNWRIQTRDGVHEAGLVVIAAGARNPFRKQFTQPFSPQDLMATAGYYIPANTQLMQVQFFSDLHGYLWTFPRADHLSAGICGKLTGMSTAQLRRRLEESLLALGLDFAGARFYSHVLPALRATTLRHTSFSGPGWAMVGDAAGFVDPITGEGLYYAMRSAELLAEAVIEGQPESYATRARADFLPDLEAAARVADRFYAGRWMGQSVIERMVQFTASSGSFCDLMRDMFAGTQGYVDLRSRLYRSLPRMLAESLSSALWPRLKALRMQERASLR